ncbi:MAG TPA: tetratricopeptide repeat protein [Caulobacter sp.]|nr:tetratricopeptide repeat protein [Caulobacter sp.]
MEPIQVAAATPRMAGAVAGDSASRAALDRLNAAVAELRAMAIQPILQQAVAALQADDFRTGGDLAIKALEMDERNGFAWYLMAIARERAGDFGLSVKCYESALALLPDHAEVANDLGRLAYRMGMVDTAEKLFAHYLVARPGSPEASNNLACALRDQGRFADAIEVLRPAIEAHPDQALLWNTLGTVIGEQGDPALSATFFDESLRIDPAMSKARYNRGNARLALGDPEGALADVQQAMAGAMNEEERLMMLLARSTINLALGRLKEGWDDYEARLQPGFADVTRFYINRPQWTPDCDVAGKTLLIFGEQGLGDEVLFANALPDLAEAIGPAGKLCLAVEQRLIPLFQRSFPMAEVGAHASFAVDGKVLRGAPFHEDASDVDFWAPIGSLLRRFRGSAEAFPARERYLTADPERIAFWRDQLSALPGPKIGLLWKSMIRNGARHRYFSPFEQWAPVLTTPGATFVNLQYGDCDAELELAARQFGVEIWQPPGIDLKNDLDDVAALCCAMDLVIGFANATINLAGACGAPVWMLTVAHAWTMLGSDAYPWYPQVRCFASTRYQDWSPIMAEVAGALRDRFDLGDDG